MFWVWVYIMHMHLCTVRTSFVVHTDKQTNILQIILLTYLYFLVIILFTMIFILHCRGSGHCSIIAALVKLIKVCPYSSGPKVSILGQSSCTLRSNLRNQSAPTWGSARGAGHTGQFESVFCACLMEGRGTGEVQPVHMRAEGIHTHRCTPILHMWSCEHMHGYKHINSLANKYMTSRLHKHLHYHTGTL